MFGGSNGVEFGGRDGGAARLPLGRVVIGPNGVESGQDVLVAVTVTEAGHEGDVSLIDIAQIENRKATPIRQRLQKLLQALARMIKR